MVWNFCGTKFCKKLHFIFHELGRLSQLKYRETNDIFMNGWNSQKFNAMKHSDYMAST